MKLDEYLAIRKHTHRTPTHQEHDIQVSCVNWFRLHYPAIRYTLFAIPNGDRRDPVTGRRLKAEGVLPGVSDLILLHSNHRYGALLIELKTPKGRQSPSQKQWEQQITAFGHYKYVVCRSLDDFITEVTDYLKTAT